MFRIVVGKVLMIILGNTSPRLSWEWTSCNINNLPHYDTSFQCSTIYYGALSILLPSYNKMLKLFLNKTLKKRIWKKRTVEPSLIQFGNILYSLSLYFYFHGKTTQLKRQNHWFENLQQVKITDLNIRSKDEMLPRNVTFYQSLLQQAFYLVPFNYKRFTLIYLTA